MSEKAVVLLSGGLDSTTCLAMAVKLFGAQNVTALCIYYGQKHMKEIQCARKVAEYYDVKFILQEIPEVYKFSDCTLLEGRDAIPHASYKTLQQQNQDKVISTYVPFRNGLMLSYASAIALSIGATRVMYGAHADDVAHSAYPDCSESFVSAMAQAMKIGSGGVLSLNAPLVYMTKAEVVQEGLKLKAPYQYTWSCYEGGIEPCGKCSTCLERMQAFRLNGAVDPIMKGVKRW